MDGGVAVEESDIGRWCATHPPPPGSPPPPPVVGALLTVLLPSSSRGKVLQNGSTSTLLPFYCCQYCKATS